MNRTKLKNYAPQARKDFIEAVTAKAEDYGLTKSKIEPMTQSGDVVIIAGKPFPKAIAAKRRRLEDRIRKFGFEQTMESVAYTCFNRFIALRYMEIHGYLEHGFRVISSTNNDDQPEILQKAQYVDLPGLDQRVVTQLKLDGNRHEELYRLILTAQFNALSKSMPFLFERLDDETELLLPDKLLHTDSLIRKLVNEIDEEDWQEVEIIGWLYQFYISVKKDEVIGKVVKSEDIPAATQLFTPNWIVKYLVQNTIGRQWLATYPDSGLRAKMEYYIEPAEQTPEVQEQLKSITPTSLNPEELTLLDPACGSGHILVEAYDLFKAIYQERGYRSKDIPALILKKNLFGLEIDDRAAQLASFALMMKARADYARVFELGIQPNVVSFVESKGLDAEEIHYALISPLSSEESASELPPPDGYLFETENNLFTHAAEVKAAQKIANVSSPDIAKEDIASLVALFENAKTFGSLIQVPTQLIAKLPEIQKWLNGVLQHGDLTHASAHVLKPLVKQAFFLSMKYDSVVANPPYMGGRAMNTTVKSLAEKQYANSKYDTYAMFIVRAGLLTPTGGAFALVTMHSWMFLSTFAEMRSEFLAANSLTSLAHLGARAFPEISGEVVKTQVFSAVNAQIAGYKPVFFRLLDGDSEQKRSDLIARRRMYSTVSQDDFSTISGSPMAYWINDSVRRAFRDGTLLSRVATPTGGMTTGNNSLFVRFWWEVSHDNTGFGMSSSDDAKSSGKKWFPYNKGGTFRKWFGNNELVVNWRNDGEEILAYGRAYPRSRSFYFRQSITWTATSSSSFAARHSDVGRIFDAKGSSCFANESDHMALLAMLCSSVIDYFLEILNPTLEVQVGDVGHLPIVAEFLANDGLRNELRDKAETCVDISRIDWNSFETSWDFQMLPVLQHQLATLRESQAVADAESVSRFARMKELEEENNRLFIEAYGLQDELSPEVPDDQITLYRPDRTEDIKRLISYIIGFIMGRYSLDKPGLIYAHSGNEGFDPSQYITFRADDDGIIPLLDSDWGIDDDATLRIKEFVGTAWDKDHLDENLSFIAESLEANSDNSLDTIRRYLSTGLYKHHLSMYKKRPIYWLFSSGKNKAFQCLVYLHRYNESTLSRMRTEYVIPLMGKMNSRLEFLQGPPDQKGAGGEIAAASAVTVRRKLEKERDSLKKQIAEIQAFDEKLRHYADLRIKLDLDDGVKVNYGKFSDPEIGDILAEVKAICGTKDED